MRPCVQDFVSSKVDCVMRMFPMGRCAHEGRGWQARGEGPHAEEHCEVEHGQSSARKLQEELLCLGLESPWPEGAYLYATAIWSYDIICATVQTHLSSCRRGPARLKRETYMSSYIRFRCAALVLHCFHVSPCECQAIMDKPKEATAEELNKACQELDSALGLSR